VIRTSKGADVMEIILFEDGAFRTLAPLTLSRPSFFLRTGAFTAAERVALRHDARGTAYLCRDYLAALVSKATGSGRVNDPPQGEALFLNGAVLAGAEGLWKMVDGLRTNSAIVSDGALVAAKAAPSEAFALFGYVKVLLARAVGESGGEPPVAESLEKLGFSVERSETGTARHPWEIVSAIERTIAEDWAEFETRGSEGNANAAVHLEAEDAIYLGPEARVDAGAVIDATAGPVIVESGARVGANAVVYGPCYIGRDTLIKAGSRIYGPCSFGPVCKLGGEIAETVVQAYSNKQHEGFLGHAFLGEWVNLGAGTEVSDLKNNYGPVKVWSDGAMADSGQMFVGPTIGDHSKTGINSMLNTGAVIGFSSNVFGAGYLPKFVPSFAWGGSERLVEHDPAKALETARVVMSRRKVQLDEVEEALFREVYEITRPERERLLR